MKKVTSIAKRVAVLSFAVISCASLMLAPVNRITAPLQNYHITASASSNQVNQDTLVLSTGQSTYSSSGKSQTWYSKNRRYQLTLTQNGNLILKNTGNNQTVWSTGTGNNSANTFRLVMQGDGNLVLYSQPRNSKTATATWNSQTVTKGNGNKFSVRLSNEGELYVYYEQINQSIWSSRSEIECTANSNTVLYASQCISSKNRVYRAIMQSDGNFVIYRRNNGSETATWHTYTYGNNGAFLALQQDGNLVVYSAQSRPLFNTETSSRPFAAYKLTLGDDGVLRLVQNSGKSQREIWNSKNGKGKIETMLTWAVNIANDNSHGWNINDRLGNPDYDCSSFVCTAAHQAGFNVSASLSTYTMKDNFVAAGFTWIPWEQIGGVANLKRGDILLDIDRHTEIYLGNNQMVGAHSNYDGKPGDSSGKEISVGNYSYGSWNGVLRYNG